MSTPAFSNHQDIMPYPPVQSSSPLTSANSITQGTPNKKQFNFT
jgi:hypothetical protein